MHRESLFDLKIVTLRPSETPPSDAHWVRIADPDPGLVRDRIPQGWFYKPKYVTYALAVPRSMDEYISRTFASPARSKPRRLLREIPGHFSLVVDRERRHLDEFVSLYRKLVVSKPRGRDRIAEHESGFGPEWTGYYLFTGANMTAGVLVYDEGKHYSIGYGAIPHGKLDLEHYLIMQVLQLAIERGDSALTLGMDTNRYGHHLSLHLPAYKLRLGFVPLPYEPSGRELVKVQGFDVFEEGLFFYAYEDRAWVAHLFTRGEPDVRPFTHPTTPPWRLHPIP